MRRSLGKPPPPKYHYKLITASNSQESARLEAALRESLRSYGLSFFSICRLGGTCDVVGDSGASPLSPEVLKKVKSLAQQTARQVVR